MSHPNASTGQSHERRERNRANSASNGYYRANAVRQFANVAEVERPAKSSLVHPNFDR